MDKNNQEQVNEVPIVNKIISVIYWIFAILLLFGFISIISNMAYTIIWPWIIVIILLGCSILSLFIAIDLWKGKNWARIAGIAFSILIILVSIALLIFGDKSIPSRSSMGGHMFRILNIWISIILNAIIGGYLLFNKK